MRLLFLLLALLLPLTACGDDDDNPFGRGDGDDDDGNGDDDDVDENDLSGWVEFQRRSNVSAENTVEVFAFAAYFQPGPVQLGAPVPQVVDTCTSGTDQPGVFDLPPQQIDVGNTIIELIGDDGEVVLDEVDAELNRFLTAVDTESWVPEQEYTVRLTGGDAAEAASFDGILGTPEVMALTDDITQIADGLLIRWFGQNGNGHIEARFIGEPLQTDDDNDGAVRWVACRLNDDGQHTLLTEWFEVFDGDVALVELLRKRSTDFEYAEDRVVRVVGSSVVHTPWTFPDVPGDDDDDDDADDDDDDSGDDDDSAR